MRKHEQRSSVTFRSIETKPKLLSNLESDETRRQVAHLACAHPFDPPSSPYTKVTVVIISNQIQAFLLIFFITNIVLAVDICRCVKEGHISHEHGLTIH